MVRFPNIKPSPKYQSTAPRVRECIGELPLLRGTEKQITWANAIRDELLDWALVYYFSHGGEDEKIKSWRARENKTRLHQAIPGGLWERPRDCVSSSDAKLFPKMLPERVVAEKLPEALKTFVCRHRDSKYWIENTSRGNSAWEAWEDREYENNFVFDFLVFFIALYVQPEK